MPRLSVTLDDADIRAKLREMGDRARDLRPAMETIGEMLKISTDRRFETATDPDGNPWTPLAASTVARKAKAGHELMLQWSGRLRQAVAGTPVRTTENSVTLAISNLVYAAIHQFGGEIIHARRVMTLFRSQKGVRNGDWRFVKQGKSDFSMLAMKRTSVQTIPARPYMGISDPDIASATTVLRNFVLGATP